MEVSVTGERRRLRSALRLLPHGSIAGADGGLNGADGRPQLTGCEQPRPQRSGPVLPHRRKQPENAPGLCAHAGDLPLEFCARGGPVSVGEGGCLGGIRCGTQGMCPHMCNSCGLRRRSGGSSTGRRRGGAGGPESKKTTPDLTGGAEFTGAKSPSAFDGVPRPTIIGNVRFEQCQNAFGAVSGPNSQSAPVCFAQRLRRTHGITFAYRVPAVPRFRCTASPPCICSVQG